jgi:hypothetical protein
MANTQTKIKTELRHPHMKLPHWCAHFDMSRAMAHKLIRTGKLKAFKIGGSTIIDGNSIADMLEGGAVEPAA